MDTQDFQDSHQLWPYFLFLPATLSIVNINYNSVFLYFPVKHFWITVYEWCCMYKLALPYWGKPSPSIMPSPPSFTTGTVLRLGTEKCVLCFTQSGEKKTKILLSKTFHISWELKGRIPGTLSWIPLTLTFVYNSCWTLSRTMFCPEYV